MVFVALPVRAGVPLSARAHRGHQPSSLSVVLLSSSAPSKMLCKTAPAADSFFQGEPRSESHAAMLRDPAISPAALSGLGPESGL